jgi:histone H3/H4
MASKALMRLIGTYAKTEKPLRTRPLRNIAHSHSRKGERVAHSVQVSIRDCSKEHIQSDYDRADALAKQRENWEQIVKNPN